MYNKLIFQYMFALILIIILIKKLDLFKFEFDIRILFLGGCGLFDIKSHFLLRKTFNEYFNKFSKNRYKLKVAYSSNKLTILDMLKIRSLI